MYTTTTRVTDLLERLNIETERIDRPAHVQEQIAKAVQVAAAAVRILNKPARSRRSDDALALDTKKARDAGQGIGGQTPTKGINHVH